MLASSDVCAICGGEVDKSLAGTTHPLAPEVDEIVPVSRWYEGGYDSPTACALDPHNVRLVHRVCNIRRGAATAGRTPANTRGASVRLSRDWTCADTWSEDGTSGGDIQDEGDR